MDIVIALAIPVFFLLIGLELVALRRKGLRQVRFVDAISSLSCGIGQQMTGLLIRGGLLAVYVLVHQRFALMRWDAAWWGTWVVALLALDHQYYWWHRLSHRSRLLWAAHVVHHQSEDYNLPVALRQTWLSAVTTLPFNLPLALLGIPPEVLLGVAAIDLLYQFWIHTEVIDRMGPLEEVLNTPSHHRVHHGVDPVYIDRNHAGILIVWDRLYGTFARETHRPTYGTVTPFGSGDPVWANVEPLLSIAREARRIRSFADKVRYVLGPPEWRPAELGGPVVIPEPVPGRITWDPQPPAPVRRYVLAWFVVVGAAVTATLAVADQLSWATRAVLVAAVVGTTWVWSPLIEGRPWATLVEQGRLVLLGTAVGAAAWAGALDARVAAAVGAVALLSLLVVPRVTGVVAAEADAA